MKSLVIYAILALIFFSILVSAVPPVPYNPWGTASIDNSSAPDGLLVQTFINNTNYANTTTTGGGWYSVNVPGDDSDTPQKEGGVSGEIVNFKINNTWTNENGTWNSGSYRLDLTATTSAPSLSITVSTNTLDFGNLGPETSPGNATENPLNITIDSNTNYQVTKKANSENFTGPGTLKAENLKSSNVSSSGPWSNYTTAQETIFSGSSGTGINHNLYNQLTIPAGTTAGNYNLDLIYKVSSI